MKRLRWGLGSVVAVGAVLAVSFVLAAAPPPAADSESASRLLTGPHSVATLDTRFVDSARPTRPNGDFPGSDVRRLEATLWFPESATGRLPLVIYSHGFMSSRGENADLAELLASHAGFAIFADMFPLRDTQPAWAWPDGPGTEWRLAAVRPRSYRSNRRN